MGQAKMLSWILAATNLLFFVWFVFRTDKLAMVIAGQYASGEMNLLRWLGLGWAIDMMAVTYIAYMYIEEHRMCAGGIAANPPPIDDRDDLSTAETVRKR